MRRRIAYVLTLVAFLLVSLGSIAVAQDELTLESVAQTVATLTETVTGLSERVGTIEEIFADPWSPEVIYTDDGVCQNPLHARYRYGGIQEAVHQETADAYRSSFGVSIDPDDVDLRSISFEVEGSNVYIEYTKGDRVVVEKWAHCEFLGHSEWSEEE